MHPATDSGDGLEPFSHESLLDGRDPRRLDKLASARDPFRRLLVRRFRHRAAVPVYVLADLSASLAFRGAGDRLETLAAFTGSLGYAVTRAGDAFGFVGCDSEIREDFFQPPTRERGASTELAERLRAFTPRGRGSGGLLQSLARLSPRRSLVFVVSDFHFPLELLDRLLGGLARHSVVPVVLVDSAESQPPPAFGIARVTDLETGMQRVLLMRPSLRRRFVTRAAKRREALVRRLEDHGVEPLWLTDRFDADAVNAYFHG
jgi:uncharacterized protein (DUF58 family)